MPPVVMVPTGGATNGLHPGWIAAIITLGLAIGNWCWHLQRVRPTAESPESGSVLSFPSFAFTYHCVVWYYHSIVFAILCLVSVVSVGAFVGICFYVFMRLSTLHLRNLLLICLFCILLPLYRELS